MGANIHVNAVYLRFCNHFWSSSYTGIVTALTWPASLLAVASVIDNPWGVCLSRSAEVGKHLAQVLRSRQQVR